MLIVIGIIAWIFTANSTGSIQLGFYFGAIVTVLCYQERRISALLAQRAKQEVSAPLEALAVRKEPVTPAYLEPPPSAPSEEESPPNEVEILVPPFQVTPDSEALFRPTAQILEDIIGPTLAGFILRGNLVARMGVIVLFFGVLFALKLAVENGYLPIELRLTLAALGSFVLLGLGWKIQEKKRQFSITLEGAGMGILYITVFIAFRLYHLIPGPLAFALLFAITALSAVFAVIQDARTLALLAIIGGFLAPALTSEGGGSHILLFSYCALLNLGIFGICLYRSWHALNFTGFFFTVACWVFLSSLFLDLTSPSDTAPLPYIPLINPLDIAQSISLGALLIWAKGSKKNISAPLAVWLFVWATSSLLRAVHHYGDVPWDVDELVSSIVVQSSLSIFWSILALVLMWTAHNRAWRAVWTVGAVLITVVVAKLFLIDLSSQGFTGRMVAFIGVGLLMLGIGYVAPIPPAVGNKE